MIEATAPGPFHPGPGLFRHAVAVSKEASYWGKVAADRRLVAGEPNPGQRELDACVATVLFTHAAIESEWHWRHLVTGTQPTKGWPWEFDRGLAAIAAHQRLPHPGTTADELRAHLSVLGAWRNFFQHGDHHARQRLAKHKLTINDLDAGYASAVITHADAIFGRIAEATGGQRIGPSHTLWTGFPPADA